MAARKPRYQAKGKVFIAEVPNTETLIKNLSSTGLCIESTGFMDVLPKERYVADIVPEKDSNINQFSLEIETRWVKAKMKSSESGFAIVFPPGTHGHAVLEQYLNYLASRPGNEEKNCEENEKGEEINIL